jgi:hypothetical protein
MLGASGPKAVPYSFPSGPNDRSPIIMPGAILIITGRESVPLTTSTTKSEKVRRAASSFEKSIEGA